MFNDYINLDLTEITGNFTVEHKTDPDVNNTHLIKI